MTPSKPGDPAQGRPDDAKIEQEAKDSKAVPVEAEVVEAEAGADAPKPKRPRKKAASKAEATAAEATGVGKEAAEAATHEGSSEPVAQGSTDAPAAQASTEAPAAEASTDEPAAEAPTDEPAPAGEKPKRRRRAAADAPAAPAPAPKRAARSTDGAPPMVNAHAKYVRTSARKARLVCDHIRGKSVDEARAILAHASRDVARDWSKLLESAVANAEHNHELVGDELKIAAVKADEGPTLKRFRPRAMGRATKIRKRTSHLTITLTPKE
jgi:ribosomal protein L22